MPATDEMIQKAVELLAQVNLDSFKATPSTIYPFKTGATLSWNVNLPIGGSGIKLTLNGSSVKNVQTITIQPPVTMIYTLEASLFTVRRSRSVSVTVDTSACYNLQIPEFLVRPIIQNTLKNVVDNTKGIITQRETAIVEVDTSGIEVRPRLQVSVEDFFDPDVNIDITMALRAENGKAVVSYQQFNVEVDWPWYVTGITLGISEFVESVVENMVEIYLKPMLLEEAQKFLDSSLADYIPKSHRLYLLTTTLDQINLSICPIQDVTSLGTRSGRELQ